LVAAHLEAADPIGDLDLTRRTALVFGNEREGVSAEMLAVCDGRMVIPMAGFTQSFNISVAAAIALYHVHRVRQETGRAGDLSPAERHALLADYCMRSVGAADAILRRSIGPPDPEP
jgi:tRNA (guanosine-2'-O-)-methyltransferase